MKLAILALLYLSLASTFGIAKIALAYGHPVFIIAIRMLLAGIVLLLINRFRGQRQPLFRGHHLGLLLQLAFFHIYCAFIPEFWALQYLSGAKACFMYSLSPFITALLEYFLLAKQITRHQFYGLLVGFVALMSIVGAQVEWSGCEIGALVCLPDIALLFSVISASYGWILLRKLTVEYRYSLPFANGISMFIAGIAALITTTFIPGSFGIQKASSSFQSNIELFLIPVFGTYQTSHILFWGSIILLILIANIIFYNMYGYLLRSYSPTFLSFAGFVTPLFAAGYDWIFFQITPPISFFAAVFIVFCGLYLFYQDELIKKNS